MTALKEIEITRMKTVMDRLEDVQIRHEVQAVRRWKKIGGVGEGMKNGKGNDGGG